MAVFGLILQEMDQYGQPLPHIPPIVMVTLTPTVGVPFSVPALQARDMLLQQFPLEVYPPGGLSQPFNMPPVPVPVVQPQPVAQPQEPASPPSSSLPQSPSKPVSPPPGFPPRELGQAETPPRIREDEAPQRPPSLVPPSAFQATASAIGSLPVQKPKPVPLMDLSFPDPPPTLQITALPETSPRPGHAQIPEATVSSPYQHEEVRPSFPTVAASDKLVDIDQPLPPPTGWEDAPMPELETEEAAQATQAQLAAKARPQPTTPAPTLPPSRPPVSSDTPVKPQAPPEPQPSTSGEKATRPKKPLPAPQKRVASSDGATREEVDVAEACRLMGGDPSYEVSQVIDGRFQCLLKLPNGDTFLAGPCGSAGKARFMAASKCLTSSPNVKAMLGPKKPSLPCPVCKKPQKALKRHALAEHLPFYVRPELTCWRCGISFEAPSGLERHYVQTPGHRGFSDEDLIRGVGLCVGLLHHLRTVMSFRSLEILLANVQGQNWHSLGQPQVPPVQRVFLSLVERYLGGSMSADDMTFNPPNCVAALLFWETLTILIGKLRPDYARACRGWTQFVTPDGVRVDLVGLKQAFKQVPVYFVDPHYHLDRVMKAANVPTLAKLEESALGYLGAMADFDYQVVLHGTVSNNIEPAQWENQWASPKVVYTLGVHPRHISDKGWEVRQLQTLATTSVAVGECGLDELSSSLMILQERVFVKQLQVAATLGKPVVLHLRVADADNRKAVADLYKRALELCQANLGKQHKVHLHCFAADKLTAEEWLHVFPCTIFGIAGNITSLPYAVEALKEVIPLHHLVVETDSPYFLPQVFQQLPRSQRPPCNTPWFVPLWAREVAAWKGVPTALLLEISTWRTLDFYGL